MIAANQFESYFRVNSVFWDPNVYGRFLALVMTAVAAFLLWSRRPRIALGRGRGARGPVGRAGADVLAVELRGAAGGPRGARGAALGRAPHAVAAVAGVALAAAIFVLAFQDTLQDRPRQLVRAEQGHERPRRPDRGRRSSCSPTGRCQGYGSGSFGRAYRREQKGNQQQAVSASHTLPVTVAAEQGLIGLAAYAARACRPAFLALFGDRVAAATSPPAAVWHARRWPRCSSRWSCTRWSTPRSSRTRSPG